MEDGILESQHRNPLFYGSQAKEMETSVRNFGTLIRSKSARAVEPWRVGSVRKKCLCFSNDVMFRETLVWPSGNHDIALFSGKGYIPFH